MELGKEIKKDFCPPKYCTKGSIIKDSIPTLVALALVTFFSGNLFYASGLELVVTIIIEVAVAVLLYGLMFLMLRGMKTRLAETYISVCENGVCGICPKNGFKNREFSILYSDIRKVSAKGDRFILYASKGNVTLTLQDAEATCAQIQQKMAGE